MLIGTWLCQGAELGGQSLPFPPGRLVITGDRYLMSREGEADEEGHLRVDTSCLPNRIALVTAGGRSIEAIFRVRGNLLQISYFAEEGGAPPTEFSARPGSWQLVLRYRRDG